MKNKKFFVSLFSIVLAINMITTGCSKETNKEDSENSLIQNENNKIFLEGTASEFGSLQSFSADTLDGGTFTQKDIAAKDITVINFWSLMCGPCIKEMPDLAAFAKALPDNIQMVTVCLDGAGEEEVTKDIVSEAGYEGITLLSGDGDFEDVSNHIQYTPTTVIVDAEGNLIGDAIVGGQKDLSKTFLKAINTALKASKKEEIRLEK